MLEHLFGSKTRVKLLRLFFSDPEKRLFVREATRLLDVQINAVRRELEHLVHAGIILVDTEEATGDAPLDPHETKRKYYRLNERSVLYQELRALLMKAHVLGEDSLVQSFISGNDVQYLLFTGMFTNAETPIDLLLVGTVTDRRVSKVVGDFEKEYGFSIRYTIMPQREFQERRQLMDRFIYSVLDAPHHVAIDRLASV